MKFIAASLLSRIPPFLKRVIHLRNILGIFIAVLLFSYLYFSQIDKINHKILTIKVNGETATGLHHIKRLDILIGINSSLFKDETNRFGFLNIGVIPPDSIEKLTVNRSWYNKYFKNIYYISDVQVKSSDGLPIPTDFKEKLGTQLVERSFKNLDFKLHECFDILELSDTCVRFKHLMSNTISPEIFYYAFDTDIANTPEAPFYVPTDVSTICFTLKIDSHSQINDSRLVITYSAPLNIMTIIPTPDKMTPESIIYEDSLKMEQIFRDGFYILAQDVSRLHNNNMKSFWSATILGACISIIAEILFRMTEFPKERVKIMYRKRKKKKYQKKNTPK